MKTMHHHERKLTLRWRISVCFLIVTVLCLTMMVPALADTAVQTIDFSVLLRKNQHNTAWQHLSPDEQKLYDYLKEQVFKAVTSGDENKIDVPVTELFGEVFTLNAEEVAKLYDAKNDSYDLVYQELRKQVWAFFHPVLIALERDEPGLFFWEKGSVTIDNLYLSRTGRGPGGATAHAIYIRYPILQQYSRGASFNLEALTQSAAHLANAQQIISKYASASDYEKLRGYADELIARGTAKVDVSGEGNDRNPVFILDDDPDTNVACVGYSQAFAYLCSQTVFDSPQVNCLFIAGWIEGTPTYHAWNVVTMEDGKNYLVDNTFADGEEKLSRQYFLRGQAGGSLETGYQIRKANGSFLRYIYGNGTLTDMDCLRLYGAENLTLADADYTLAQRDMAAQMEAVLSSRPRLIDATPGVSPNEEAENLFDGDVNTKWCVSMKNGPVFVEWQEPEPIVLQKFLMATANDNSRFPGRNPCSWVVSARNSTDEEWKVLWSKENYDFMKDEDYKHYAWVIEYVGVVPEPYSFFRLEITKNQGADVLQLSKVEVLRPDD